MIVIIGYVAFALNVAGNLLLAHKNTLGWGVRLLTNIVWIVYAMQVENGLPMVINHLTFLGINAYGLWSWKSKRNKKEKEQ